MDDSYIPCSLSPRSFPHRNGPKKNISLQLTAHRRERRVNRVFLQREPVAMLRFCSLSFPQQRAVQKEAINNSELADTKDRKTGDSLTNTDIKGKFEILAVKNANGLSGRTMRKPKAKVEG